MTFVLTAGSTIMCPHGGTVTVVPTAIRSTVGGELPLRVGDVGVVAGCPFATGPNPSPCVRVEWTPQSLRTTIEGAQPLTNTSVGLCLNVANVPQGPALIVNHQFTVSAGH